MAQLEKNLPADAGHTRDIGLIPGSGRPPGEGNGNPLSILAWSGYPTDRGAWQGTVHGGQKRVGHDLVTNNSNNNCSLYILNVVAGLSKIYMFFPAYLLCVIKTKFLKHRKKKNLG